jgi:hypothetical protein
MQTNKITSTFRKVWNFPLELPEFSQTRIMMMPVILGSYIGIPEQYTWLIRQLYQVTESRLLGHVGYLTIDEKIVRANTTLRRSGIHVDGYYNGKCGAWGGGGGWGSVGNGMLTISNTSHCKAWLGIYDGIPGDDGECGHIELNDSYEIFEANQIYWVDGACIHESLPVVEDTKRQFVRLSMPSNAPWFEGYTINPGGILPSNDILPKRVNYMNTNI